MGAEVTLDSDIALYVLGPMVAVIIGWSLITLNLGPLFFDGAHAAQTPMEQLAAQQTVASAKVLARNAKFVPRIGFEARRRYYCEPETGVLANPPKEKGFLDNAHPAAAKRMMVEQGLRWVLQILQPQFLILHHYFTGYFVAKTPFPMTHKLKWLLQKGMDVPNLDSSYISSFSFACAGMEGIRPIIQVIHHLKQPEFQFGEASSMSSNMLMHPGGMPPPGAAGLPGGKGDPFTAERNSLQIVNHKWALEGIEEKVLKMYGHQSTEKMKGKKL
eukprot:Selendium_serpulae@DN3411_c0_g1_i1.p1